MATGKGASGPTKRDRREEARETARKMREEAAKKAKRRKIIVQSSVIVGIVAVLAIVGGIVLAGVNASNDVANPKNMLSGGILLTKSDQAVTTPAIKPGDKPTPTEQTLDGKTAHIQVWLDYQCPYCDQFETTNAPYIKQLMDAGTATLETHPIAILDNGNNNKYSTRSAAAMACVANYEPNKFFDLNSALFANQPDETTGSGLTNAEMLKIFKDNGVDSKSVTNCVNDQTYEKFVGNRTLDAAQSTQVTSNGRLSTPAVFVNGERYQGSVSNADQFKAFIETAVKDAGTSGSLTFPTPAPSK